MRQKIERLIIDALLEIGEEKKIKKLKNAGKKTFIYGNKGSLDSISLVLFLSIIEEKISDELNTNIILASEKAMSRINSPFRSVESLTDYILELMNEN